ncbi:flagellar basal-body rod protein FlgG [Candidatus Njordibacter sp. Uisw_056]|jgi:flagellar basal-body rod protein FlgG|uniref:flagellar basal-body rod protein FlgG n=1 Tax=Candidatus Njordibacter sp. Uisw_056 TaxID=3230973 RepID=UPI003D597DC4|tara:strand:+ start:774 stop:1559 length:786 start_codon:yes stop_codon:yes gene_type:complete
MDSSLWVAKTGLDAQQRRMSVVANNLANVNTTGFKRDRAVFEDLLYQTISQPGAQVDQNSNSPTGLLVGTGTRVVATEKIHSQGNMIQTDNALDVAINGDGFLQTLRADGSIGYTRDGSFKLNNIGQLVTANGNLLQPTITIPNNSRSITIGKDGTVSVQTAGQPAAQIVGNIQIASFINPAGLQAMGGNNYKETSASGAAQVMTPTQNGAGSLVQGSLEASNVNVVESMVNMIETQRAYEVNSKAIAAADGMLRFINNNL